MNPLKNFFALVFAASIAVVAPASWAHEGHTHHHHETMDEQPAPPARAPAADMSSALIGENSKLRLENEQLKKNAAMDRAMTETDKAAPRVTFIVLGVLCLAAGLFVRYLPEGRK